MDLDLLLSLLTVALDELENNGDLINQVLEVTALTAGGTEEHEVEILRYRLPEDH